MLLNRHGEERGEDANVGEQRMTTLAYAASNWYGEIGAEKGVASGKLTA